MHITNKPHSAQGIPFPQSPTIPDLVTINAPTTERLYPTRLTRTLLIGTRQAEGSLLSSGKPRVWRQSDHPRDTQESWGSSR